MSNAICSNYEYNEKGAGILDSILLNCDKCEFNGHCDIKTAYHKSKLANENIVKGFEEFTKMMFKQEPAESEEKEMKTMTSDEINEMVSANTSVPKSLLEEKDNINPDHYKNSTSLECIEAMELIFGQEAVANFCVCNAWKYIWRWKHKNGLEDLEKAKWYVKKAEDFFRYSKLNLTTEEYETHKHMIISMRNYIEANNCAKEQDGDK